MKKNRKKLKQIAGQKRAEMLQRTTRKNRVTSRQVNVSAPIQVQDTYRRGSSNAVVKNKENKALSLQRPVHQRGACFQNQSGKFHHSSDGPAGRTWHQPYVRDQFTQSTHNQQGNLSVNHQCINMKVENSQTDRLIKRPHNTQRDPSNAQEQVTWPAISQYNYYNTQYNSASDKDFYSDHLPQNGAIIFNYGDNESTGPSQPGEEVSHCPANPAAANKSVSTAPIGDVDVSAMLRQIRRALGVREPCRADREAKKQSSGAGVQVAGTEKKPPTDASSVHSPAPAAHPTLSASNIAPAKPKQTTFRMTEETPQHCQKSSVVADGVLNTPVSLGQCMGKTMSSEPNLNISRRVRIAHEPGISQGGKEARLEPTLNKLFSISGARSRLSWTETYEGMKRKNQDGVKGMPR